MSLVNSSHTQHDRVGELLAGEEPWRNSPEQEGLTKTIASKFVSMPIPYNLNTYP